MKQIASTSSLPAAELGSRQTGRLLWVRHDHLLPHPANSNVMPESFLETLARNIELEKDYEPIVVRPHPTLPGYYQIIAGEQRYLVLGPLGHQEVLCYLWPCDDATALLLLATLNRLEGQDDPLKRAELLAQLAALAPIEQLAQLLPEDAGQIQRMLALLDLDLDAVLADLQRQQGPASELRAITFAVTREDEQAIEDAVCRVAAGLEGTNRRGRALARIARAYATRSTP